MTRLRNILICFGVFWLSAELIAPFASLFGRVTERIIFEDGLLGAIVLGIVLCLGRAFCAILAGSLVTLTVTGRNPERWAFILAALYVVVARARYHWHLPPTEMDRLTLGVDWVFPGLVCIAAAFLTARLMRGSSGSATDQTEI